MPEVFRELFQVQAAQNIVECLSAHVSAEYLAPARLQLAIATLAQESKWAQFLQLISNVRVLVLRCSRLALQLLAQLFHGFFSFRANFRELHRNLFDIPLQALARLVLQLVQALFHRVLDHRYVLRRDLHARLDNDHVSRFEHDGTDRYLADAFLQGSFEALAFFNDRLQAVGNLFIRARLQVGLLLLQFRQPVVTFQFDLLDLVINLVRLLAL